jgi:hypothetical protein
MISAPTPMTSAMTSAYPKAISNVTFLPLGMKLPSIAAMHGGGRNYPGITLNPPCLNGLWKKAHAAAS